MLNPLVSIVIPCYNHQTYVAETIQSVIDQGYQNIELIIIDDGSKDGSVAVISSLEAQCLERFKRFEFRSRPNKGLSATLNEALSWCEGEFYSALASDDRIYPDKIERQVEILNNNKSIVAVFGGIELINEHNQSLGFIREKTKIFKFEDLMCSHTFLPAPTQLIRLKALREVGGYIDGMIIEDWYSYLKLLEFNESILYIDQVFSYYRSHGENTYSNPYQMALGRLQVLHEFRHQDLYEKAYIKANWDNVIQLTRKNFILSMKVFLSCIAHNFKLILKKILK